LEYVVFFYVVLWIVVYGSRQVRGALVYSDPQHGWVFSRYRRLAREWFMPADVRCCRRVRRNGDVLCEGLRYSVMCEWC
jgi:hypothetical protein